MVDESLVAVERGDMELAPFFVFSIPSWGLFQDVLASELDKDDFVAVASAVMALGEVSRHTSDADGRTDAESFSRAVRYLNIPALRRSAAAGYNALCGLTGYPRVDDLLTESQS
jgi:hypothetical protein